MPRATLLFSLVLWSFCSWSSAAAQARVLYSLQEELTLEPYGAVTGVGDVNADGIEDLLGYSEYSSDRGSHRGILLVFSGADGSVLRRVLGANSLDYLAACADAVGDVNGDGIGDFAAGTGGLYDATRDGRLAQAKVFSGKDGSLIHTVTFGKTKRQRDVIVSRLGDVNRDGRAEFLAASPYDGIVQVINGATGRALRSYRRPPGSGGPVFFGNFMGAADVDDDGIKDAIVSASTDAGERGTLTVYSGKNGKQLYKLVGAQAGQRQFVQAKGLGDVDGDGAEDFATLERKGFSLLRELVVYSGRRGRRIFALKPARLPLTHEGIRRSVADLGDINGDRAADFAVVQHAKKIENSKVQVFASGKRPRLITEVLGATRVGSVADRDGDGGRELVVNIVKAVPYFDRSIPERREVLYGDQYEDPLEDEGFRILSSKDFATELLKVAAPRRSNMNYGDELLALGDLDGDGVSDFLVGAPTDDAAALNAGRVFLYSGKTGMRLREHLGERDFDNLGRRMAPLGDINGDGRVDYLLEYLSSVVLRAISGADGSILYEISAEQLPVLPGPGETVKYLSLVASVGDLNADGLSDFSTQLDIQSGEDRLSYTFFHTARTGAILQYSGLNDIQSSFYRSIPDATGDGKTDWLVTSNSPSGSAYSVQLFSPASGRILGKIDYKDYFEFRFSPASLLVPDLDGDGLSDFLLPQKFSKRFKNGSFLAWYLEARSSASGAILGRIDDPRLSTHKVGTGKFGQHAVRIPDQDGDGANDFALGRDGFLYLFSSKSLTLLGELQLQNGPVEGGFAGSRISSLGDIDADGSPELLVSGVRINNDVYDNRNYTLTAGAEPRVYVVSLR